MDGREQGTAGLLLVHLPLIDHRLLDARLFHRLGTNISEEPDFDFIRAEGEVLKTVVAPWFGTFFWIFGAVSLVLVALGVLDYISRLVADALKTLYLQNSQVERAASTFPSCGARPRVPLLLSGLGQPLLLLVSACLNGIVMFIYSFC